MPKCSKSKTDVVISVNDRLKRLKTVFQWITNTQEIIALEDSSVHSVIEVCDTFGMTPTLSEEQRNILNKLPDILRLLREGKKDENLERKYASLLKELGERKAHD